MEQGYRLKAGSGTDGFNTDQVLMLGMMSDVRASMPQYEIRPVTEFPPLTTIKEPLFIGSFAWTAAMGRWKLVDINHAINAYGGTLTPADVARDYVRAKYGKPHRVTSGQYEATVKIHRFAPMFARVGEWGECSYLDLKSAYWSILQVIGWDVDYHPGRWLNVRSTCRDFPLWRNKMARNCLVSVGLVGQGKRWDGQKLTWVKKSNPLANLVLYAAVQDILHSVAYDMIQAGAVYVHTDGYILPKDRIGQGFDVLRSWGLVGSIRNEGPTTVYAAGTYTCGSHENARSISRMGKDFSNVIPDFRDWLKPRFKRFADRERLILS